MVELYTRRNIGEISIDDSSTPILTPTVSCAFSLTSTQTPVLTKAFIPAYAFASNLALASASVLGSLGRYTDKDLQRTTKFALELFVKGQEHSQLQANSASCKQPLKARVFNLYYVNLYLNCYFFC